VGRHVGLSTALWMSIAFVLAGCGGPSAVAPAPSPPAVGVSPSAGVSASPEPISSPSVPALAPSPALSPSPTAGIEWDIPSGGCRGNLGKIVFSYNPGDLPSVHYGIYLMDADGSNRVRLSGDDAKTDQMPAWSPERCRIAFVRFTGTRKGDDDIYVMSADGKRVWRLTTEAGFDKFPDWSPDGRQISFISDRDGSRNLYVMYADGSNQRQLTNQQQLPRTTRGYVQWQQWSPDGGEIAFTYNPGTDQGTSIYLIRPDGTGLRQLVDKAMEPAWSPDGQQIYFLSNRGGRVEIWVINRDGTGLRQVSNVYTKVFGLHSLRVSPDGKRLAFYGQAPDAFDYGNEIFVINIDGSSLMDISRAKGQDEWLDW
jgi:TolB protein